MNPSQNRNTPSAAQNQGGFMLLEALIAILIFSIGVLGIVGMQASAVKASADNRYRAEAITLADGLFAEMTAANHATLTSDYALSGAALSTWVSNHLQKAGSGLPNGTVKAISVTAATGKNYLVTLTLSWRHPGSPDTQLYTTQTLIF